jgi:copper chaperone
MRENSGQSMKNEELKISGMTCNHCVMSVKKELSKLQGVEVRDVGIGYAHVTYDESKVSVELLRNAVEEAGFTLA